MAALSDTLRTGLLQHIFQNAAVANIGDASGLQPSGTAGSLYIALHSADPTSDGSGAAVSYGSYARVAVARSGAGWTVASNQVTNAAVITFPTATSGSTTATHVAVWTALTGGTMVAFGPLALPYAISTGITPQLAIGALALDIV